MSNESLQISPVIKGYLLSRGYTENFTVSPIAGAGSGRQYFRISEDKRSCVLQVCAEVNDDFRHFVDYSKTFRNYGLPVPQVFAVDETACQVLQEDLGKVGKGAAGTTAPHTAAFHTGGTRSSASAASEDSGEEGTDAQERVPPLFFFNWLRLRRGGKTEADRIVATVGTTAFAAECRLAGAHVGVP